MASKASVQINIVDKGLAGLLARVRSAYPEAEVEIGVIEDDPETAYIAKVHELGLGNNKPRSFLRGTLEAGKQRYERLASKAFGSWLDGRWTMAQALNAVGIEISSDVKKRILKGIPPALQKETVAAKRRAGMPRPRTPLYATGKLYEAIRHRIVERGRKGGR